MTQPFNAVHGLIKVDALMTGPKGIAYLPLALDTGATGTVLNEEVVEMLGFDLNPAAARYRITTGSRVESAPQVVLTRLRVLGCERFAFPVLCFTLPSTAGVHGIVGLDFLRGLCLTVDFRQSQINLA